MRELSDRDRATLIGNVPMWVVRAGSPRDLETGPRTDKARAQEIRYIPELDERLHSDDLPSEALVMVEGRNRYRGEPPHARAEVGWAFGVQNAIEEVPAAATGFAVLLGGGKARLVQFQLVKDKDDAKVKHESTHFRIKVLEEHPLALAETADVQVVLQGAKLEVRSGGHAASFKAPAARGGFHGLMFRELGYAGVSALKLSAP
jgi:hypothetical protein